MTAQLSVIIPSRNRPVLIRRAVQSILDQDMPGIELIVVDDASAVPYEQDPHLGPMPIKILRNKQNQGPAAARNAGIAASTGAWVAFLDDDDEWLPGFARRLLDRMSKRPDTRCFSWCSIMNVDYDIEGTVTTMRPRMFRRNYENREELFGDALSIGASWGFTVGRECFGQVGLFDTAYKLTEDTEFIFRLLAGGCEPLPIDEVGVKIHHPVDPSRLTNPSRNGDRIADMDRIFAQYSNFLDGFPRINAGLHAYVEDLRRGGTAVS